VPHPYPLYTIEQGLGSVLKIGHWVLRRETPLNLGLLAYGHYSHLPLPSPIFLTASGQNPQQEATKSRPCPLPLRSAKLRQEKIAEETIFFKQNSRVMNNYELMVIFTPILSDDEFKAAQKKYTALVAENGGRVVAENPWGLKSLAYPIQKKTTGLYWVTEFITPSDFNEKLKIQLLRDEGVLRHMVTKLDKYAVEYNQKKRSGVPTGTEKVQEA
jgi:small subunit ribosomal protein S6